MKELTTFELPKGATAMTCSRMMMHMLLLAALLPLAACQTDTNRDLGARAYAPLPDVPVAEGFELVELRSRTLDNGQLRFVDHMYQGRGDKFAVERFYEKQMPISGWTMEGKQFVQGRGTMDFVKGSEHCRITYYDESLGKTAVLVTIWPLGHGPAASQPK
jgi:hypothetical protein